MWCKNYKANEFYNLEPIVSYLKTLSNVPFVLDNTPHPDYNCQYTTENV